MDGKKRSMTCGERKPHIHNMYRNVSKTSASRIVLVEQFAAFDRLGAAPAACLS